MSKKDRAEARLIVAELAEAGLRHCDVSSGVEREVKKIIRKLRREPERPAPTPEPAVEVHATTSGGPIVLDRVGLWGVRRIDLDQAFELLRD